jgi:hypothetical protein
MPGTAPAAELLFGPQDAVPINADEAKPGLVLTADHQDDPLPGRSWVSRGRVRCRAIVRP